MLVLAASGNNLMWVLSVVLAYVGSGYQWVLSVASVCFNITCLMYWLMLVLAAVSI